MDSKNQILRLSVDLIQIPSYKERIANYKKWVSYGENNLFPQFLIDLMNKSALHNAIVKSKLSYSYGYGLENDKNEKINFHTNYKYSFNELYKRCLSDIVVFGGFAVEIFWEKGKIKTAYHIPFENVRSGRLNEYGEVDKFFYCSDWLRYTSEGVTEIDAYDPIRKEGRQLFYYKNYCQGQSYYPIPSYTGALNYIAIDGEISNFHLAHLSNGMSPNFMIKLNNGIPSDEEKAAIRREFENQLVGSSNAGKFILSFSDNTDSTPSVEMLSADNLDEQFMQLNDSVLQQILSGHQVVSPMLVGIETPGTLGGRTELVNSYKLFYVQIIKDIQDTVVSNLNRLLSYSDFGLVHPTERIIEFED